MMTPGDQDQRRLVTVEQAEADYFAQVEQDLKPAALKQVRKRDKHRAEQLQKPMGYCNDAWVALKAKMRPGDELWEFCSARESWDGLMGWAGYELVRDGQVIESLTSKIS